MHSGKGGNHRKDGANVRLRSSTAGSGWSVAATGILPSVNPRKGAWLAATKKGWSGTAWGKTSFPQSTRLLNFARRRRKHLSSLLPCQASHLERLPRPLSRLLLDGIVVQCRHHHDAPQHADEPAPRGQRARGQESPHRHQSAHRQEGQDEDGTDDNDEDGAEGPPGVLLGVRGHAACGEGQQLPLELLHLFLRSRQGRA